MIPFPHIPPDTPMPWLSFVMPVGSIIAFAGKVSNDASLDPGANLQPGDPVNPKLWGWLLCDGSSFSKEDFPFLYKILNSETLPDLRGYFLRGAGEIPPATAPTVTTDTEKLEVGQSQSFAIHEHEHDLEVESDTNGSGGSSPTPITTTSITPTDNVSQIENRPFNYAVNYLIRATYQVPLAGNPFW